VTQTSVRSEAGTRGEDGSGAERFVAALSQRRASGSLPNRRTDGFRLALAIEGGGMRGTVSAGMALGLEELGLLPLFDAVYGASAGAISSAWLLSSRPEGLRGWSDPAFAKALIRRRNVLRGRPLVDVTQLVEVVYREVFPLDFGSVLANPIELHPLATDVTTGAAADLHPHLADEATLRLALRASSALPLLAGGPVTIGGRRYFDAGLAESVPFRQALRDGATHVLVLRSRRSVDQGRTDPGPTRGSRFVARYGLRRYGPELREVYMQRPMQLADDDRDLAGFEAAGSGPALLSLRPDDGSPRVGRLASDGALLVAAFEAGRAAARGWVAGVLGL
jgi:predicted patatin/cPLA2 family phospholipase